MKYVVSAAPMYDDGSIGDHEEVVVDKLSDFAVNEFLMRAASGIGETLPEDPPVTCDALDVTISPVRS